MHAGLPCPMTHWFLQIAQKGRGSWCIRPVVLAPSLVNSIPLGKYTPTIWPIDGTTGLFLTVKGWPPSSVTPSIASIDSP